jgi:hypothetical protein
VNVQSVGTNKPVVFVRFQPDVKEALDNAAFEDGRSLSSLLEKIAVGWLREHGRPEIRLQGPKKRGAAPAKSKRGPRK